MKGLSTSHALRGGFYVLSLIRRLRYTCVWLLGASRGFSGLLGASRGFSLSRLLRCLCVSPLLSASRRWGTVDADINVPSVENSGVKFFRPLKPGLGHHRRLLSFSVVRAPDS